MEPGHRLLIYSLISIIFINQYTLSLAQSQELYNKCGQENVVCVGARNNLSSFNSGGCIKEKNCQVVLIIEQISSNARITQEVRFEWELAIEYDESAANVHHFNSLFLAVYDKKVSLTPNRDSSYMQSNIPFWHFMTKESKSENLVTPKIYKCEPAKELDCERTVLNDAQIHNYVTFGLLGDRKFSDTQLNYIGSSGKSRQVLRVEYDDDVYKYDLINDKLTIALFHWFTDESRPYETNFGGNFEPMHLFKNGAIGDGDTTEEQGRDSQDNGGKKMTWLWIVVGVVGILVLVLIVGIICCCFCFCKKTKRKTRSKSREIPEPGSFSTADTKTVNNTTISERSVNGEVRKAPTKASSNRLNYIAQLAGYDPSGKPLAGPKVTPVKAHDFNKSFHSASAVLPK